MNMGASWYIQINFPVKINKVFATPASASTAAGSSKLAASKQNQLIKDIFNS
jgi:2-oxoglutarate dehydrogenase complex dehydrogenase (E1) component-like enzyme